MSERILVVDDGEATYALVEKAIGSAHELFRAERREDALQVLREEGIDLVLTGIRFHDDSGLRLCREVHEARPDVPVIVITGLGSMETAVAAIRAGAIDFLTLPVEHETVAHRVELALRQRRLEAEVERLRDHAARSRPPAVPFIGESVPMRQMTELIARVAESEASILITGESGTGKELVARTLHDHSHRKGGAFVAINCAAISAQLLESELFGHRAGAFTDAKTDRRGLFVESSGGTLFLDEIGEMPMEMQTKLLRALQERRVRPVGSTHEVEFDTRILTATNVNIDEAVSGGDFREDLFYRINVVRIRVPPLRDRGNDVLLVGQHFLDDFARRSRKRVEGFTPDAARKLLEYDWPGNVRELQNVVERAVTLTQYDNITPDDLPERVLRHRTRRLLDDDDSPDRMPTLADLEERYIHRVLEATKGNKSHAAKVLGLDRRTLYRKLERYEKRRAK